MERDCYRSQGQGSTGSDADFDYVSNNFMNYDYSFLNKNISLFAENVFYLSNKFSVTPGLRYQYINTTIYKYSNLSIYQSIIKLYIFQPFNI